MILDYLIRFVNIFYNTQSYGTVDSHLMRQSLYHLSDAIISDTEWNRLFDAFRLDMMQTLIQDQLNLIARRRLCNNTINRLVEQHGVEINDDHRDIIIYESEHDMQIIFNNEMRLRNRYFDNLQRRITWRRRFRRCCGRVRR